jgi:hypothetical protein
MCSFSGNARLDDDPFAGIAIIKYNGLSIQHEFVGKTFAWGRRQRSQAPRVSARIIQRAARRFFSRSSSDIILETRGIHSRVPRASLARSGWKKKEEEEEEEEEEGEEEEYGKESTYEKTSSA